MPLFKDFDKDVKDLLTKNYAKDGAWKIESKFKGPDSTLYINPSAEKGKLAADICFNVKDLKLETTTNISDKGWESVKPKITYKGIPDSKIEISSTKDLKYEVTYEGNFAGKVSVFEKVTPEAADTNLSVQVAPHCSIGGLVSYSIKNGSLNPWQAGVQYAHKGALVSITTTAIKQWNTGVLFPVDVAGKNVKIGATFTCGDAKPAKSPDAKAPKNAFSTSVGFDTPCILVPGANLRARVDYGKDGVSWAVAYIAKLSDAWKAAFSLDGKTLQYGVNFTRE